MQHFQGRKVAYPAMKPRPLRALYIRTKSQSPIRAPHGPRRLWDHWPTNQISGLYLVVSCDPQETAHSVPFEKKSFATEPSGAPLQP
jgi:hypothetical protein